MALHQTIQNILLLGVRFAAPPAFVKAQQPKELTPLIAAIAPSHLAFNARAVEYGHRYRSAFWALYLLSALAVLSAALPLALGWDDARSRMAHFSGVWVLTELLIILLVASIYWRGHRQDWQGQWLAARTKAELAWYLPLLAPLIDFSVADSAQNWYARLFDHGEYCEVGDDLNVLCTRNAALAQDCLATAWSEPQFVVSYTRWAVAMLESQRLYHLQVARRQHALRNRVHGINGWLFGLTAVAAATHLLVHSRILTLLTTFCPALVAALHGALAQSEAYRLEATSERLANELEALLAALRQSLQRPDPLSTVPELRETIQSSLQLILNEHKDWHMLVRPHHLPLG